MLIRKLSQHVIQLPWGQVAVSPNLREESWRDLWWGHCKCHLTWCSVRSWYYVRSNMLNLASGNMSSQVKITYSWRLLLLLLLLPLLSQLPSSTIHRCPPPPASSVGSNASTRLEWRGTSYNSLGIARSTIERSDFDSLRGGTGKRALSWCILMQISSITTFLISHYRLFNTLAVECWD